MGHAITAEAVVRIVVRFSKQGPARFIGHLDLHRVFQRAARRAGLPLAYSQGFNPHPHVTFASPLPVGAAGRAELAAFDLAAVWQAHSVAESLNLSFPEGLKIVHAWAVPLGRKVFGARIESAWCVRVALDGHEGASKALADAAADLLRSRELLIARKEGKTRDVRPYVLNIEVRDEGGGQALIAMNLLQDGKGGASPRDMMLALQQGVGPIRMLSVERVGLEPESLPGGDASRTSVTANAREEGR